MNDVIETRVRNAYLDLHLAVPLEEIIQRSHQLRHRRRAPWLTAAAVGAAAAAAVVAVVAIPGGQSSAFASWRAHPTRLAPQSAAAVATACRAAFGDNRLPAQLVEGRGDFAFAVFTDGTNAADCLLLDEHGQWRQGGATGPEPVAQKTQVTNGTHTIAVETSSTLTVERSHHAASVWGWVAPSVTSVRIYSDGGEIDASVSDGVFAAWWPTSKDALPAMRIVGYDANGHQLDEASVTGN